MPNIKQQEKRMRLAARQTMRNRQIKSSLRTMFKKLEAGVGEGDQKAAEELARHQARHPRQQRRPQEESRGAHAGAPLRLARARAHQARHRHLQHELRLEL